jgi:hypothetical protein
VEALRQAEQEGRLAQSVVEMDAAVINQNRAYDKGYEAGQRAALAAMKDTGPIDLCLSCAVSFSQWMRLVEQRLAIKGDSDE